MSRRHDTESERDAVGDVEPLKVVTTNVCQPTVELQLAPPHPLRAVACPSTLSLPQRAHSCSSQPYW